MNMHSKHKFFALGIILGLSIPFVEHYIDIDADPDNPFEKFVLFGTSLWHYIFLYTILINSILLYVQRLRRRINPESRIVFLISGISFGFALISIIAATVTAFQGIS